MSEEDEDDKFLYGSDEDQLNTENNNEKKRTNEEIIASENSDNSNKKQKIETFDAKLSETTKADNTEDLESSEDESDFDVEIIVSKGKDPTRLDSDSILASSAAITSTGITTTTTTTIATSSATTSDSISIATDSNARTEQEKGGLSTSTGEKELEEQAKASIDMAPGSLDIDKDGLYDGEPVTQIDPEVLKEKPWRKPGADVSDYFNYGFNEYTWMEYLDRQEKWREEYNPRKILMGLLSLQQQGKLDPTPSKDNSLNQNTLPNMPDMNMAINKNMNMNRNGNPPQMMNPFPMFGGFPPFMPGMLPNMNPQQGQKQGNTAKPQQSQQGPQLQQTQKK
ncbi:similar to Saccharomyces cerevisiae YJR093C FIP1 Subunit of cleavage polyadenylation factor (CPF), interacts directly with poly(A) polymerase (Pap1p) to regulate its activity [Maudiozyma saulgeensis]|uniref:Pre-mRNA polyadenylation factor FIP1 n=1 Tax=Maudiozyma saulgeensis TaxID=1789683 RepID=A0A1X7R5S2_9SACH|nr:similar to Saccharomyces cerevisiae YJR093C FIP1 Subunit of cleavage polyadenylation factor (CPF), interacts directly with poly(A) polymerase (Pap1p) to regulate its activity [Kazachstania saulgeensis]